ncbi:50S ribosomal protein L10 [Fibrobacter sp.]|uniref:50S ribosomal protein L10 n=1 Tax=Fibrobacter sp. TaxID=35828 RepID=UPI003890667C
MKAVVKKQQTVDALVESFKDATAVYLLNYQGMTVDKDNALRKALAAKGVKYHAVKNTLLKRVLAALKVEGLDSVLTGATSVMVGFEEDPLLPAREIEAFHKANPDFLVAKSVFLDGKAMPGSEVVNLSKIPDRKGMIAQIVSIALGPGSTIAGQIKTLQEKLEKESGSEAPAAEAAPAPEA